MTRECLWCDRTLDTAGTVPRWNSLVEPTATVVCECGVVYSIELVEGADDDQWDRIKRRDGFSVSRDRETLWVTDLNAASRE